MKKVLGIVSSIVLVLGFSLAAAPAAVASQPGVVEGQFDTLGNPNVTVDLAATSITPQVEQLVEVTVQLDGEGRTLADLSELVFKLWYDSTGTASTREDFDGQTTGNAQTCAIITWTNSGDHWAMEPSGTTWVLGSCSRPNSDLSSGTFDIRFTPGKVATATTGEAKWQIGATATDEIGTGYGADDQGADMNWYGEVVSVANPSVNWGTVGAGLDFSDDNADVSVGAIKYISNGDSLKKAKSDATWESAGGAANAILDGTGVCATGNRFALKADDDATLDGAATLNSTGAQFATGSITSEGGQTDSTNTLWLKLATTFDEDVYSGTITYLLADGAPF